MSRVHWPSTARVGKLQVKLFDHDPSPRALGEVWVVLDMRTRIGGGESQASEFCVTVAASLLKRCMDLQFPTGLVVAENGNVAIQPGEGRDHRWRLLEALAVVRSGDGPFLHEILSRDSERFSADSVVLTVTPVADRHLVVPLCRLAGRVGLVMAIVVGLPPGGGDRSPVRRALASAGVEVFTVRDGHDVAASLANSGFMGVGTGGVRSGATPGSVRPVG